MIDITVTSSEFPKDVFGVTFLKQDVDKFGVWKTVFNTLRDMLYEKHTGKNVVTGMLEDFERKKEGVRD